MTFKVRHFSIPSGVPSAQAAALEAFITAEQAADGGGWDLFSILHGSPVLYLVFSKP